ncbi:unnamed protein product [Ilex paraguariensis]|uniref:F-box domain-containing protein n=1 Tax=Ilex paraguariensis TaxID=185542 RepID=A0ABC8R5U2_9AQUA
MEHSSELPEDNIVDVLNRLPSRPLARFKCVSRRWHEYISETIRSQKWRKFPTMMGFFFQNDELGSLGHIRFLFTTKKPENFDDSLDESFQYMDWDVAIVASSNGFLLGSLNQKHPMRYCVYNPATTQCVALPKTRRLYNSWALGFVCEPDEDDTCTDAISFTVVRLGLPNSRVLLLNKLTIEIFSSATRSWKTIYINLNGQHLPLMLYRVDKRTPAVVIGKVFYWLDYLGRIIACDLAQRKFMLMNFPQGNVSDGRSRLLVVLNGQLCYASINFSYLELWVINHCFLSRSVEWVLKDRVSIETLSMETFGFVDPPKYAMLVGFHSTDTNVIYFSIWGHIISYRFDTGTVELVFDFGESGKKIEDYKFYQYEWHKWPRVLPFLRGKQSM